MPRKPKRARPTRKQQHSQQILLYQINKIRELWSQGLSNNTVATIIGIGRRTVDKLRLNLNLFNELYLVFVKRGPIRRLNREQEDFILDYIRDRPTAYLQEIQQFLYNEFEVVLSKQRISEIIKEREFSKKAVYRVAAEQNALLRTDFEEKIKTMPAYRVCCVDESISNQRTSQRKYRFSPINTLCKD